jgi:hypothetical protein
MVRRDLTVNERQEAGVGTGVFGHGVAAGAFLALAAQRARRSKRRPRVPLRAALGVMAACALPTSVLLAWCEAPRLDWLAYGTFPRRTLRECDNAWLESHTRFHFVEDVLRLQAALGWPDKVVTRSRYSFAGEEALLTVLARFGNAIRLDDLAELVGRRPSHVSELLQWAYDWRGARVPPASAAATGGAEAKHALRRVWDHLPHSQRVLALPAARKALRQVLRERALQRTPLGPPPAGVGGRRGGQGLPIEGLLGLPRRHAGGHRAASVPATRMLQRTQAPPRAQVPVSDISCGRQRLHLGRPPRVPARRCGLRRVGPAGGPDVAARPAPWPPAYHVRGCCLPALRARAKGLPRRASPLALAPQPQAVARARGCPARCLARPGASGKVVLPGPPCTGANVAPDGRLFNGMMSSKRISVEWGFGRVGALWKFIGCKNKMQMYLMPVASMYYAAWLLADCHCCLYGNQVSDYFTTRAPPLDLYLDTTGAEVPLYL